MLAMNLQPSEVEEYKVNLFSYRSYKERLHLFEKEGDRLKVEQKALSTSPLSIAAHIASFAAILWVYWRLTELVGSWGFGESFTSSLGAFLFFFAFYGGLFLVVSYGSLIVNVISFGKYKELEILQKKTDEDITNLRTSLMNAKALLRPFETKVCDFYQDQLTHYFENNLYKRLSGSREFEESLSEFSGMIKELQQMNSVFVTEHISLFEYEEYLHKRSSDHAVQIAGGTGASVRVREFVDRLSSHSESVVQESSAPERNYRIARKIANWEDINKKRKVTGLRGEEIVVALEQDFFESIGRSDLALSVRHISVQEGDGLGYDVLSSFENGKEKYIEVKTSTVAISTPYYLSRNELSFIQEHPQDAFIYRVFLSEIVPEVQVFTGAEVLDKNELIPVQFVVKAK